MVAELRRFQSRQHRAKRQLAAELDAQLALFGDDEVPPHERETVRNFLHRIARPNSEQPFWGEVYNMISRQQTEAVWDAIRDLPAELRPQEVRHAFDLVLLYLRPDTGEVVLSRMEMASKMRTNPDNVSRAMSVLERMEVITRKRRPVEGRRGPGRVVYSINPYVAWNGRLDTWARECAATAPPSLKLVQPSDVPE